MRDDDHWLVDVTEIGGGCKTLPQKALTIAGVGRDGKTKTDTVTTLGIEIAGIVFSVSSLRSSVLL